MQSNQTMTSKDLEAEFGRCISDIELAKYINVDVRTLRKYAHWLGGVMVMPGKYRFFENLIKEKLNHAELNHEKRCPAVSSERAGTGDLREKKTETFSGQRQKILQKRTNVGGGNKETAKGGNAARSRHGVF